MAQAALLPLALAVGGSLLGAGAAAILAPKPKLPPQVPPVMRNTAAEQASADKTFRQRLGAGANEITGGGAEAARSGGKTLLGQ